MILGQDRGRGERLHCGLAGGHRGAACTPLCLLVRPELQRIGGTGFVQGAKNMKIQSHDAIFEASNLAKLENFHCETELK